MHLLYWTSLIVIIMLFVLNIIATPILQHKKEHLTLPVHKTLYIDRHFSDAEFIFITDAALEWETTTNEMVSYDVVRLPKKNIDTKNSIVIVLLSVDFPDIIALDTEMDINHLGYYYGGGYVPYIGLVTERIADIDYKTIVMHELGHSLGLQHPDIQTGVGELMYYNINMGANYITENDLKQFCHLYKCDPSTLHDQ